jgi:hypothetical protein
MIGKVLRKYLGKTTTKSAKSIHEASREIIAGSGIGFEEQLERLVIFQKNYSIIASLLN